MPRGPKKENLRLRALLDEAGISNKGLARRIVDVAAIGGAGGVRCDHTSVLRWLAGEQPRPPVPELAAIVFSDALGRKLSETELGMTPSNLPGDLGLQLSTEWADTIATSTALWRADVQRRRFLVNAVFTSAALSASALRWLTSPTADAPAASGIRRVGRADIDAIHELTRSFNLSLLATAYAARGEPEQACVAGRQALELTVRLSSARSVRYVRDLTHRLRPRADVPAVRDFMAEVRERLPATVGRAAHRSP